MTNCIRIVNWKGMLGVATDGEVKVIGAEPIDYWEYTNALDARVPVHFTGKEDTHPGHWCEEHDKDRGVQ